MRIEGSAAAFPDEGEVEFAVALQPAETVTVTVLLPDGQPATRSPAETVDCLVLDADS